MADFTSQYIEALKAGNESAQAELVVGEIATLVNEKPLTVIQTISATTKKEFVGKTYGDLTAAVAELLKTSPKFASAMVALVYLNTGIITHDDIVKAGTGDFSVFNEQIVSDGGYKNISGGGMDMVTAIVGAVGNITGGALQLASAKAAAKGATDAASLNLEVAKTQAEASSLSSKEGTKQALLNAMGAKFGGFSGTTVIMIVGVLALGIAGVYMLSRSSTKPTAAPAPAPAPMPAPVFEVGGLTPPVTPPVAPVAPVAQIDPITAPVNTIVPALDKTS